MPNHNFNLQCMLIQDEIRCSPEGDDYFSRPDFINPEVMLLLVFQVRSWRSAEHEVGVPHPA
jgi:hypothetical protein